MLGTMQITTEQFEMHKHYIQEMKHIFNGQVDIISHALYNILISCSVGDVRQSHEMLPDSKQMNS